MVQNAPLWSLIMSILSLCLAVGCVMYALRLGSRFTHLQKWARKQVASPPSDAKLIELAVDQASLSSTVQSLATTIKRLSSRSGMQDIRERRSQSGPPPPGASKRELREYYGISGVSGPDQARRQQEGEQ